MQMTFFQIFVSQQFLFFLFSKHLNTMANVTDCVTGKQIFDKNYQKNFEFRNMFFPAKYFIFSYIRVKKYIFYTNIFDSKSFFTLKKRLQIIFSKRNFRIKNGCFCADCRDLLSVSQRRKNNNWAF